MRARQESVDATRDAICRSTMQLWLEHSYDDMTLDAIAELAGVTRQTVIRHFGSKEDLVLAAAAWYAPQLDDAREAEPGDVEDALSALVRNYEFMGDANLRMLQVEERIAAVRQLLADGRAHHRAWVEHVFAPWLSALPAPERNAAVDALYAATDVTVWKLLRRDFGRSAARVQATIRQLVDGVLADLAPSDSRGGASS